LDDDVLGLFAIDVNVKERSPQQSKAVGHNVVEMITANQNSANEVPVSEKSFRNTFALN